MTTGKFVLKPNKVIFIFLMLIAFLTAGFTVFCQMPGDTHSYNLLLGKDDCQKSQSPQGCGFTLLSHDILGFNLLSDSKGALNSLSLLIITLFGVVYVIAGRVPLFQAGVKYRFRFQFLARLHNYLIQAFSQGILNPQIFAI